MRIMQTIVLKSKQTNKKQLLLRTKRRMGCYLKRENKSYPHGSAVTNPVNIREDTGLIPGLIHGLRIRCCWELWCRGQTRLGVQVAVAVAAKTAEWRETEAGAVRSQAGLLTNRVAGSTEQRELRLPALGARAFLQLGFRVIGHVVSRRKGMGAWERRKEDLGH